MNLLHEQVTKLGLAVVERFGVATYFIEVRHDPWCQHDLGLPCNCSPDLRAISPTGKAYRLTTAGELRRDKSSERSLTDAALAWLDSQNQPASKENR